MTTVGIAIAPLHPEYGSSPSEERGGLDGGRLSWEICLIETKTAWSASPEVTASRRRLVGRSALPLGDRSSTAQIVSSLGNRAVVSLLERSPAACSHMLGVRLMRDPIGPERQLPGKVLPQGAQMVDLKTIQYSQEDISWYYQDESGDARSVGKMAADMKQNGWDPSRPADIVRMPDGRLVSVDHRRLWAADKAGITQVSARIHDAGESLAADEGKRFTISKGRVPGGDNPATGKPFRAGDRPANWGDAIRFRSAAQEFSKTQRLRNRGPDPGQLAGGGTRDASFPAEGSPHQPSRTAPGVKLEPVPDNTGTGGSGDHGPSHGGGAGPETPARTPVPASVEPKAPPVETRTPASTAAQAAGELAEAGRSARRWSYATIGVNALMHSLSLAGMILEYAEAHSMATATLAHGSPFWKPIEQAADLANRATQERDFYKKLEVVQGVLPAADAPWEARLEAERVYFCLESDLDDTADQLGDTLKEIADQRKQVKSNMDDLEEGLLMPLTSLAYAKAYLYAEAGGRVNQSLDEAEAAFTLARSYVRQTQSQAQGCIKALEITAARADNPRYMSDDDLDDLKGMRIEKFTIRAQRFQYDGLCRHY